MRLALNPLQWDVLAPSGVDVVSRHLSPEVLREVRAAGFGAVPAEPEALDGGVAACRELLADADLEPAPGYHAAPLAAGSLTERARAEARAFAVAQVEMGLAEACLSADVDEGRMRQPVVEDGPSAEAIERLVEAVSEIAGIWREVGLVPCIHNHVGSGIQTGEEIDAVLAATESAGVCFCPDTGHLAWAGVDPVEAIERHRDRVRLVHVKDFSRAIAARAAAESLDYGATVKAGLWREPGFGDVDLGGALGALGERVSWVIVEVDHSPVTPSESTLRCWQWAKAFEEAGQG